ncbi:MAG TPA: hypothetical protein VIG06_17790 [Kofleriaceae bacterium]|jgi:hypothetical protein
MTRIARLSLAAVLLAAAAPATAAASDGRAALELVPDWAGTIVVLDAEHMRRSALFDDIMTLVEKSSAMRADARLLRDAGFDLRRDLRTVVLASQPDDPGNALLLVEGRIDVTKLMSRAVKNGGARRNHRGVAYVEVSRGKLSIAELAGYLVIAPSPRHMKAVVDVHQGSRKSAKQNRKLMSLVDRTGSDGDLWMVIGISQRKRSGDGANQALAELKTVTASLDAARGLHMQVRLYAASAQGAAEVASYLEQLSEQSADHPDVAGLFAKLAVKRNGTRVDASLKLSTAEMDSLTRKLLAAN